MASAYFELTVVKNDLGISGAGLDTTLNDWSDKVESHINDEIHDVVSKGRLVVSLPDVPLTGTAITETIKDACNAGVKAKYYEVEQRDLDRQKNYEKEMAFYIRKFIDRLEIDRRIYGRVIR